MSSRNYLLPDSIHSYIAAQSRHEPELLRRLREETQAHPLANMQIAPDQGQFLQLLVKLAGARRAVEVGVFTGYSALSVALALPEDGKLAALDISDEYTRTARRYWAEAGVAHKIDLRLGPALASLDALIAEGGAGQYDFAFIDADKPSYPDYYERCLTLLRPAGLIAVDNVLQEGRCADPSTTDANALAMRAFNEKVAADGRVLASMLPLADGVTLALKR